MLPRSILHFARSIMSGEDAKTGFGSGAGESGQRLRAWQLSFAIDPLRHPAARSGDS
jgi:hypothetical protein